MKIIETALPGVLLIQPKHFHDNRGYFFEAFHQKKYAEQGIETQFVQDNYSFSHKNVIRGLHYQRHHPQGKLVYILSGKVIDVIVDIRRGSPTFGEHVMIELSADSPQQIYIPAGYAHGFCTLTNEVSFIYKCTDFYRPDDEKGIRFDDPDLHISWPIADPILSEKDAGFPSLSGIPSADLPEYTYE